MCSSIPACSVLLESSPVLLCLSLAGNNFSFPFPAFPLPPTPTEAVGLEQIPVLCMHRRNRRSSPRPGALTVPGNPCWDGLSLWRAPSCPGKQGDRLSTPELFHTPAQAAAHAPQEDPHSSPAPHNSSPQSPHVHRDTGVPGTCSNFSCQGAAALCSAPRAALLRGGG